MPLPAAALTAGAKETVLLSRPGGVLVHPLLEVGTHRKLRRKKSMAAMGSFVENAAVTACEAAVIPPDRPIKNKKTMI